MAECTVENGRLEMAGRNKHGGLATAAPFFKKRDF
jgi:hypothetical protein